ncbi:MAG: hypothetical protein JSR83_26325 [Proteobacteria bacterium]|nr:hypothetical protein [Pseudomonadota bacterium]
MAERPDPYVKRSAGDIIRADDWNEAQVLAREALAGHDHGTGNGAPIPREGIREKAIDGSRIDPAASVTVQNLEVRGSLKLSTHDLTTQIADILTSLGNTLGRSGGAIKGSLSISERLTLGSERAPSSRLQLGNLTAIDAGGRNEAWTNLGSNAYYDGAWKRIDSSKAGVNVHMNPDADGQEFRFLRVEADGGNLRNIATLGSKVCAITEASVGIGTGAPAGRLDVRGAIHAGGSDLYFTETGHRHTGFGNHAGYAALENDGGDYNALMILGRSTGGPLGRVVKIWDNVFIAGNLGTHGFSPVPKTPGWQGGIHTYDIEAEATIWARNNVQTGNRDLAENFDTVEELEAGDVVSLDPDGSGMLRCRRSEDPLVLGVVSSQPGLLLGADPARRIPRPGEYPVALSGRVPCKVSGENGPIRRGDLLTSASLPGHAMRAGNAPVGTTIGKALDAFDGGQGLIDIFVFLR